MKYDAESERIKFIEDTKGKEEALAFCVRSAKIYKNAVLCSRKRGVSKPHFASTGEFRKRFILSYLSFREYIEENK